MELSLCLNDFSAGQLGRKIKNKFTVKTYATGGLVCENFLPQSQGGLEFLQGTWFVNNTRRNKLDRKLSLTFSYGDSVVLSFTDGYLRFYTDAGQVCEAVKNIVAVTKANPCKVTVTGHGYSTGDEVYIAGVSGMTEIDVRFFVISKVDADNFTLLMPDGTTPVDSTTWGTASGGTVARVYEVVSPYTESQLQNIKFAQTGSTVYLVDGYNPPYKLSRITNTSWTLGQYTRTYDPFAVLVSGISKAANGVVTTGTVHGYLDGDKVYLRNVSGMTEVNDRWFTITTISPTQFYLNINTTGYTAYTSGGIALDQYDQPKAVAFYGGRLFFGGTAYDAGWFWGSRLPDNAGATRYDDFTTGTDADHSFKFPLSSINETTEHIFWFRGTSKFLVIGGLAGTYKVTGATDGAVITPTTIQAVPIDYYGSADISPVSYASSIYYAQRGAKILNSFQYDYFYASYVTTDQTLLNDEIIVGDLQELAYLRHTSDLVFARDSLGGLYFHSGKGQLDISGWAVIRTEGKITAIAGEMQSVGYDTLWVTREVTRGGTTARYTEKMVANTRIPEMAEYYTGDVEADAKTFRYLQSEAQKKQNHLTTATAYDGTGTGSFTLPALEGDVSVAAVGLGVTASDIGRFIVAKPNSTGTAFGRGEIIAYDGGNITIRILTPFTKLNWSSGEYYLTASTFKNLWQHEGETVSAVADGGTVLPVVVAGGKITLDGQFTYVIVGKSYTGLFATMPLVADDGQGPNLVCGKTINQIGFSLRNSLGLKYGWNSPYSVNGLDMVFDGEEVFLAPELISKHRRVPAYDNYESDKSLWIVKDNPLPLTILAINLYYENTEGKE